MELLWRADANSQASPSSLVFDATKEADVLMFLFVYENVAIRGKPDTEKVGELLHYLQGRHSTFSMKLTATFVP